MKRPACLLVLIAMVGCTTTRATTPSASERRVESPREVANERAEDVAQQLEAAISKADGNQPGRVKSFDDGELVLDPYQHAAGDAHLVIEDETPVFQAFGKVSLKALKPGVDVRVFYAMSGGEAKHPKVLAVQILDSYQAKEIETATRETPKTNE